MKKRRESAICERIRMRVRFSCDGRPLCPQHEEGRCKAFGDHCRLVEITEPDECGKGVIYG